MKFSAKNSGFFVGWSLLVASALFMVSGTILFATPTLALFVPELVNNITWVTLIASLYLTFVAIIVVKGIKPGVVVPLFLNQKKS